MSGSFSFGGDLSSVLSSFLNPGGQCSFLFFLCKILIHPPSQLRHTNLLSRNNLRSHNRIHSLSHNQVNCPNADWTCLTDMCKNSGYCVMSLWARLPSFLDPWCLSFNCPGMRLICSVVICTNISLLSNVHCLICKGQLSWCKGKVWSSNLTKEDK